MSHSSIDIYGCDAGFARTRVAVALAILAASQGRRVLLTEQGAGSLRLMLPCPLASKGPLLLFNASDIDDSRLLIAVPNQQTNESQKLLSELAEQCTCVVSSHGSIPKAKVVASQRHKILVAGYDGLLLQEAAALAPRLKGATLVVAAGTGKTGIAKLLAKRAASKLPALGNGALTLPLSSYSSVRTPKLEDPDELWSGLESLLAQMQLPEGSGNGKLSGKLAASLLPTIGAPADLSHPEVYLPADDLTRALISKAIKPETQLANLATRVRSDTQSVAAKLAQGKQQRQLQQQTEIEQWQSAHSQVSARIANYRSQHEKLLAEQHQQQEDAARRIAVEQKWAEVVAAGRHLAIEEIQIIDKASTVGDEVEQRLAKLRELEREAARQAEQEALEKAAAEQQRQRELAEQEEKSKAAAEQQRQRELAEQEKRKAAELAEQEERQAAAEQQRQRELAEQEEKSKAAAELDSDEDEKQRRQVRSDQVKHKKPARPKAKVKPRPASNGAAAKKAAVASGGPDDNTMVRIVNLKTIASHLPPVDLAAAIMEAKTHLVSSPAAKTDNPSLQAEFHDLTAWFHNLAKSVRKKGASKYSYLAAYSTGEQAEQQGQINLANAAYNFSCDVLEELAPDDSDAMVIWFLSTVFVVQRSIARKMFNESSKLLGTMIKNLFRTRDSFADQEHFKLMQATLTLLSYHCELLTTVDASANDADAILQMFHTMCESLDPQVSASITAGIDTGNAKVAAQAAAVKDSFGKLAA